MKINLSDVTVNSKIVLDYLNGYLDKISKYSKFDENMLVKVYVNKRGDFSAFEAKEHPLTFCSSAHKLMETIKSDKILDYVTFKDFRSHVASLSQQASV